MGLSDGNFKQISRYGRVARNSQMLLVMEPPEQPRPEVEEAREAIAEDALGYLGEVRHGIQSPYFVVHGSQDTRFVDFLAVERVRQA
ncbi:MAG: hypothetical protein ACYDAG_04540, partial [Chloroflexota bacterium]